MGKSSAPAVPEVRVPSPAEIAAQQVASARGIADLQLEKFPEFVQAEADAIGVLGPATTDAVIDAQGRLLSDAQENFPQFFQALEGLGSEAINRLNNIGRVPQDVIDQSIENTVSNFAQRGIADSPLAAAGTAGQLAALGQNQRAQDLGLAQSFLSGPFAPNVPLPGLPAQSFIGSTPTAINNLVAAGGLGNQASQLALQGEFSNRALQLSNAQLSGGGGGLAGAAAGALGGGIAGGATGNPFAAGAGALVGGIGGFF